MAKLIAPIGPPASGKSRLASVLVNEFRLPKEAIISTDQIREWLTGDQSNQFANNTVFEMAHTVAEYRLAHGLSAFLDATNLLPNGREILWNIAKSHNAEMVWIRIPFSEQSCINRNRHRKKPVPDNVMQTMIHRTKQVDWDSLPGTVLTSSQALKVDLS